MGLIGISLLFVQPTLAGHPLLAGLGFGTILFSAAVQLAAPSLDLVALEESLAPTAAVLIIGLGAEHVGVLSVLWLVAVSSGVLARGGRVHWVGPAVLICAFALPVIRLGRLDLAYAAFAGATVALLLTAGRLTSELNTLLRQARRQADSAETLLLAGDIAARVAERAQDGPAKSKTTLELAEEELAGARLGLARLIGGEGVALAVQPIVDIVSGEIHAFEALARFGEAGTSPLHWFGLADRLGGRAALERVCLAKALELLPLRPAGTRLTVNLSAPVLAEAQTLEMLASAAADRPDALRGLVVEITEETLVEHDGQLPGALRTLGEHGALLAVDDVGAGYSGLRQITTVRPAYLKLDRSLAAGIDGDPERSALVAALAGYARQVGSQLIVEGIETTAELAVLRRVGVQLVQGYRLARPGAPWPSVDALDARLAGADPPLPPIAEPLWDAPSSTAGFERRQQRSPAARS